MRKQCNGCQIDMVTGMAALISYHTHQPLAELAGLSLYPDVTSKIACKRKSGRLLAMEAMYPCQRTEPRKRKSESYLKWESFAMLSRSHGMAALLT